MSRKKTLNSRFILFSKNLLKIIGDFCGEDKKAFAEQIGVRYETVRRWCNGVNLPVGADLLTIHEKYGVSIDWLLTGTDAQGQQQTISEPRALYCSEEEFMAQWPEEIKNACRQLKKILLSDHPVIKPALISNLAAFQYSVDKEKSQDEEIRKLSRRLKFLEDRHKAERDSGIDEAASSSTGKPGT